MKQKLTVTIDRELIPKAKLYARRKGLSLSQVIEDSLEEMTRRVKSIRIPEGKELEYVSSSFTRGLKRFPAILEAR